MTKFTTLSKKVSKKEVKTVFKHVVNTGGRNVTANSTPDDWGEVIDLGCIRDGFNLFKAVCTNGSVAFYTGIKGTEFDD